MKCIPELYKQLTHLSKTINQCNYIDYEDKKDLVSDSILTILEKYNIQDTIELILEKGFIILNPKTSARNGWEKSFKKMHENGDDNQLMADVFNDESFEEWK